MKKHLFPLVLIVVAMASATPKKRLPDPAYYAQQNNQFAFDLYQKITEKSTGNIFLSPYSISSALAMTYAGANGSTQIEMAKTMRFDANEGFFHYGYGNYTNQMLENAKENVELAIANQLWGEKTYPLQKDFVGINENAYQAELKTMDFVNRSEQERLLINNWVATKTNDRIVNLLSKGMITPDTRLVLTNAIYFKGDWLAEFDVKETRDRTFKRNETESNEIPFMHSFGDFKYMENLDFQMISLPYQGNKQSMVVVLPKDPEKMTVVEKQLSTTQIQKVMSSKPKKVYLDLPKFKLTLNLGLKEYLKEMGMVSAFSSGADFSKMSPINGLYISNVVHKAFIEVDEKGSEAAAATAVVMIEKMAPSQTPLPKNFMADHPFLIYIIDNDTKAILFMGKIVNPEL